MTERPASDDIARALRAAGVSDVDASTLARATHAQDASLYRVVPQVVVAPQSADEVATIVAVARDHGVGITARGAGTSIAGNAVGPGIVVDFRRHMDRIIEVGASTAVVEPGVVLDDLQRAAAPHGARFGAEPSSHSRATIGGMIGNNACGARALGYGRTSDSVTGLEVVTGHGMLVALGSATGLRQPPDAHPDTDHSADLVARLSEVGAGHRDVIDAEFGRIPRQVSGYGLEHLADPTAIDPTRLLVGSEGTLGLVTRAHVDLLAVPEHTVLVVLGHADLPAAADDVMEVLEHRPVAIEGLDRRIVDVVHRRWGSDAVPPLPAGDGWLFVEVAGDDPDEVRHRARALAAASGGLDHAVVTDRAHAAGLWRIREAGAGLASTAPSGRPGHAGWEDSAVAPAVLGDYLRDLDELMAAHELTGMPYGHFGDGCLHIRLDFALGARAGRDRFRDFVLAATDLVVAHGGSASGEHGDGRARGWVLDRMYSPGAIDAMREVKAVLDPDGVLNPGIIVDPVAGDQDLRADGVVPSPSAGFDFHHDDGDVAAAAHRCTGVGACVDAHPGSAVMCPSYVATGREQDGTRGRARVLQELLRGDLVADVDAPEVDEALDLCLSCKACARDCPTGVDMARLKSEVLAQRWGRWRRPRSHHTLGALPVASDLASVAPGLANAAMRLPGVSTAVRALAGIDQRRDLPAFAATTFLESHRRRQRDGLLPTAAAPVGRVVLWVDTFTDHFAPEAAVATLQVLTEAGFDVEVVTDDACCGLTWITTGQLDIARTRLRGLVDVLSATGGDGAVPIVGVEPPCVAVLRDDLVELLPDDDRAASVAARARTLAEVLASRRPDWSPPSLAGATLVVQPHCHHHAVMGTAPDRALLAATGADLVVLGGCCGLAGNWGMEQGHHDVSVAIAEAQLLPALAAAPPDAIVVADGFSCRTQIDHLDGRRAHHLAEVLTRRRPSRLGSAYAPSADNPTTDC